MHIQARDFTLFIKNILREYFFDKRVLDVGSGDINGNNRFLFENCHYDGNDVISANNVTIVSKTKDLSFPEETFDTIISTECFEHDPEYKDSIIKIYQMLKPDGLFLFTCASHGRPEHGTNRTSPNDSYGTVGNLTDMSDYYKNITEYDLNEVLNLDELFTIWDTYYNYETNDLYFVGIKKGNKIVDSLNKYVAPHVEITSNNIHKKYKNIGLIWGKKIDSNVIKHLTRYGLRFYNPTNENLNLIGVIHLGILTKIEWDELLKDIRYVLCFHPTSESTIMEILSYKKKIFTSHPFLNNKNILCFEHLSKEELFSFLIKNQHYI